MLYHLLYPLHTQTSVFNVFRYITFRSAYAMVTALLISFLLGPAFIRMPPTWVGCLCAAACKYRAGIHVTGVAAARCVAARAVDCNVSVDFSDHRLALESYPR